jgi:putative DNA primase/helicase
MTDDATDAGKFLEQLRPGGPWVLTAAAPIGKAITTVTVRTAAEASAFVREYDGQRNLYYSVNPTRRPMDKKAAKVDIGAIEYGLADLDPAEGESADDAKTRYLAALKAFEPEPTAIIDSGNGIQCLWKWQEPIALGEPVKNDKNELVFSAEDQGKINDVEARIKAVMLRLGSKAGTQNIDRILRLPGTTNLPNEKKEKDGRVPCPTKLLRFNGATYPLTAFLNSSEQFKNYADQQRADLDQSGSGYGFRFMQDCRAAGMNYEQACEAVFANEGPAGEWWARTDERQRNRAWENSKADPEMWPSTEMATDLGNARRLVRLYGNGLRYVHLWRKWLVWRDGHWRIDDDGSVMRNAKAAIEEMFAEATKINDEARRTEVRKHALKSQSAQRLAAMIELAQSEIGIALSTKKLDADPYLLGVQNGVIDLRTITFREAGREDYVTKLAGTAFDPDARCPEWTKFLKRIIPSDELIGYMQRAVGYVLTGLTGEEVMFILWGLGANGKSTFREVIFALLGDYAAGADASMLVTTKRTGGATPDLARLHGRRLVTINETEQSDMLNESRVKFITSHDIITARNLYQEPFDFTPTHKTFLTTNHKPIVRGTDEGLWRRLHLLPFTETIPVKERDKTFRERALMPELPGILNWALEGLRAYRWEGLEPPEVVLEATKEYRNDMDLVGRWLEERCELDAKERVASAALYGDYELWAEGAVGFTMTPIAFGRELGRRFEPTQVERARGFKGLKLRPLQTRQTSRG